MPIRTIATLAIAIFIGLLAVVMVRSYIASARGPAQAQAGATVPVVVAAQAITRGKPIEAVQLKVANYPADAVPAGAFTKVADITGVAASKRLALRNMGPNEPVLATRISGPGSRSTLSGNLTEGMRAVSVRANEVSGVAGFVLPGDRVDVLLTRTVGENNNSNMNSITQVIAENVRVLGVDQSDDDEADKPAVAKAVTVEVTPDQAQAISLAQSVGSVSLALRQAADQGLLLKKVTTVGDLGFFGVRRPAPERAVVRRAPAQRQPRYEPPSGHEVRVTRGTETAAYTIP